LNTELKHHMSGNRPIKQHDTEEQYT